MESLFVYKMMVLPTIPKKTVKCVDNLIREFIWNGKKSKIAYNILQLPKEHGGLRLVNLINKDAALKASWRLILAKELEYSQLVYSQMRCNILKQDIWRCSINPEHVSQLKIGNQFWQDVLKSWANYNYYTCSRIENQIIWYNSNMMIGGKLTFWKDMYQKGLRYVHQLFTQCRLKTAEEMKQEFTLPLLRYNSLVSCIPKEWKEFFQSHPTITFMPIPPHNLDYSLSNPKQSISRKVYRFLADDVTAIHSKYIKWRQELGSQYQDTLLEFGRAHLEVNTITNVPKYRSFQYRILQRAITTNIQLYKWKLRNNPNCHFCGRYEETLVHMLWECEYVQTLWTSITRLIREKYNNNRITLNQYTVIFNRVSQPRGNIANFICLITKQYIYAQRCLGRELQFNVLKSHIYKIENIEKYIAIKNGKLSYHQKKWGPPRTQDMTLESYTSGT